MASGTNSATPDFDHSFDELVRFVTRTLWVLGLLVFGLVLLVAGAFISDPTLAGIAGAYGLLMALIAVSIYVVFAVLRYVAR